MLTMYFLCYYFCQFSYWATAGGIKINPAMYYTLMQTLFGFFQCLPNGTSKIFTWGMFKILFSGGCAQRRSTFFMPVNIFTMPKPPVFPHLRPCFFIR